MTPVIQQNSRDWRCLTKGDATQQLAARVLDDLQVLEKFRRFEPAHVGTIGNGLYVDGSDIDIVMSASDLTVLGLLLESEYQEEDGFMQRRGTRHSREYLVTSFHHQLPVEIYAESSPVEEQWGYRHYVLTCRLLSLSSDFFPKIVREMKRAGAKTEPAIVEYLGLTGEPYAALLALESYTDDELLLLMKQRELSARGCPKYPAPVEQE